MIRIFLFALFFFLIELFFLLFFLNHLYVKDLWKINFKDDSQRRVFKIIEDILHAKSNSIFVFGGSSSREFFLPNKYMSKELNKDFYNCAVSNQTPYDSLKLQALVKPHNIIIYGLHIKSLMDPDFNSEQIKKGYYFGGAYYKYPIKYNYKNREENISLINRFSPILNTYVYLSKEYIKDVIKEYFKTNTFHLINTNIPKQYYYSDKPLSSNILHKKLKKYFKKLDGNTTQNLSVNFSLIEKMVLQAKKKGDKFILFELPFSPIIQERFQPYFHEYYQYIYKLLEKYPNIIYISNNNFPIVKQKYFYDTIHLLSSGREYYKSSVINSLKKVVN